MKLLLRSNTGIVILNVKSVAKGLFMVLGGRYKINVTSLAIQPEEIHFN